MINRPKKDFNITAGDNNFTVKNVILDSEPEQFFRPTSFQEIIGREREKELLYTMIDSVKKQWQQGKNVALDHILFYGPAGVGKTTFAYVLAKELGVNIVVTTGPAISKPADLLGILTNLERGDILFIDEIHRLRHNLEELLYPALEDYRIDIVMGTGPSAQTVRVSLKPFTLVAATTRIGLLTSPLRDRFGVSIYLDFLSQDNIVSLLKTLVSRDSQIKKIEREAMQKIAERSRGVARIAVKFYKRLRDLAIQAGSDTITADLANKGFKLLGVDKLGLDVLERKLIKTVIKEFNGGPVSLRTLAGILNEDARTIEEVYEPYLIKIGFIQKTPRGRLITPKAFRYFGF